MSLRAIWAFTLRNPSSLVFNIYHQQCWFNIRWVTYFNVAFKKIVTLSDFFFVMTHILESWLTWCTWIIGINDFPCNVQKRSSTVHHLAVFPTWNCPNVLKMVSRITANSKIRLKQKTLNRLQPSIGQWVVHIFAVVSRTGTIPRCLHRFFSVSVFQFSRCLSELSKSRTK